MTLIATIGASNANSYIDRVTADAYFANRLFSDNWTVQTNVQKETALIMAAGRLDQESYEGYPATNTQSMRWPRAWCPKPDLATYYSGYGTAYYGYYLPTELPPQLLNAQCELTLYYLNSATFDPTMPTGLENFKAIRVGSLSLDVQQPPRASILPDQVASLLRGLRISGGSIVRS